MVGLLPELDFGKFTVIPAIRHDAVRVRRSAGEISGLRGASDGRERGFNARFISTCGEVTDARRVLANEGIGEANNVNDGGAFHQKHPTSNIQHPTFNEVGRKSGLDGVSPHLSKLL